MTTRTPLSYSTASLFRSVAHAPMMLRGPTVTFSPDEDDAFVEGPDDREPESASDDSSIDDDLEAEFPTEPEVEEVEEEAEPEVDPDPEAETPPEGQEEPPEASDEESGEENQKPRRKDWRDRLLEKRKRESDDAKREAAEAKAETARLRELYAKPEGERTAGEQEEIRRSIRKEVEQEVRQEQRVKEIDRAADKLFDDGAAQVSKTWATRVTAAAEIFGEQIAQRPDFLETVTDLDNGPAVYHELAGDPDKMDSILAMPPHRMAVALTKLSDEVKAKAKAPPRQISRAPAPITRLERPVTVEKSLEDMLNDPRASMEEINRRMDEQDEARASARRR
jgi:hypothetical protein